MRAVAGAVVLAAILLWPARTAEPPPQPPHVPVAVLRAAREAPEVSRGGERVVHMEVLVTAYCQGRITYTGTRPRYGECAVDPAIIPLGSMAYVPGYGWCHAEDTGGLIRGKRVDVWIGDRAAAVRWGARMEEVTVVER